MHNFLYSLTICLLHYYPRHVSSINMPIFRRKNCIYTASGIFALCKRLHSTLVESGLTLHYYPRHVSSINMPIFRRKNCIHTASGIFALCKRLHSTLVESGLKLVDEIILYYNARSKKHQRFIYPPTDTLVSCLKKILKFTLKHLRHVSMQFGSSPLPNSAAHIHQKGPNICSYTTTLLATHRCILTLRLPNLFFNFSTSCM